MKFRVPSSPRFWPVVSLSAILAMSISSARADPQEDRIVADRAAANAKFAELKRDCEARFIVASCLGDATKEHQATLIRLRREEVLLTESKRRAAAEAREKELRAKAQVQEGRASEPSPAPRTETTREAPKPHEPVVTRKSGAIERQRGLLPQVPGKAASSVDRASIERQNVEKFDAKARAVQVHREAVEQRNAERASQGKVAAPLPTPGTAESGSSQAPASAASLAARSTSRSSSAPAPSR